MWEREKEGTKHIWISALISVSLAVMTNMQKGVTGIEPAHIIKPEKPNSCIIHVQWLLFSAGKQWGCGKTTMQPKHPYKLSYTGKPLFTGAYCYSHK